MAAYVSQASILWQATHPSRNESRPGRMAVVLTIDIYLIKPTVPLRFFGLNSMGPTTNIELVLCSVLYKKGTPHDIDFSYLT